MLEINDDKHKLIASYVISFFLVLCQYIFVIVETIKLIAYSIENQ